MALEKGNKMKAKKEYILLAIVIIAMSFYLFSRNGNKTHYQLPDITVIDKKAITKRMWEKGYIS